MRMIDRRLLLSTALVVGSLVACSPAPKKNQFRVYFEGGQGVLTPEAGYVVGNAVLAAKAMKVSSVIITGHCDSAENSQSLSLQRAEAVAGRMKELGLPENVKVQVNGLGATALQIKTPDNTREPQNRVAVIDMK